MTDKLPNNYLNKVYAGWLAKIIGVRHGGDIEGWTAKQIQECFGDITSYVRKYNNFAADDDINGPMFFLKAVENSGKGQNFSAEDVAQAWLDYVPDGHGFFWWGGYGISTEDTAYHNLKIGIPAPTSGSIKQNGRTVAEQIGGQIFSDLWGMIAPNNPELAADFAERAASVSHDGEAIYGGRFVAAAVSAAFGSTKIEEIIQTALDQIPSDSLYATIFRNVEKFYHENQSEWRKCYDYLKNNYGYDKFEGNVHVIPNAGILALALYYGQGDFSKTINICSMCGWDTDCNVGNVAAIVGVLVGIEGIDEKWWKPINDFVCFSSLIGSENISDIPAGAAEIARVGYLINGQEPEDDLLKNILYKKGFSHFEFPTSTHGFKVLSSKEFDYRRVSIQNTDEEAKTGSRSLKIVIPEIRTATSVKIFKQTYYTPSDFVDSRYDPDFSPILYPGQTVKASIKTKGIGAFAGKARLYVFDDKNKKFTYGAWQEITTSWSDLSFTIPAMENATLSQVGIDIYSRYEHPAREIFYVDDFEFGGNPSYSIDFNALHFEKWNDIHKTLEQFTRNRGLIYFEDEVLNISYAKEPAVIYTGQRAWKDISLETIFKPISGEKHRIYFRVHGEGNCYFVETSSSQVSLFTRKNSQDTLLKKVELEVSFNTFTKMYIEAKNDKIVVYLNDREIIKLENNDHSSGMIGFGNSESSRTQFKSFSVNQ